ncbi:histidine kinase [Aestuariibacter sp. AA17]|uniref:Histidine kinase n=1 Tax=Fluctibacter corallii TaxID=2984329 RepID=A0ABT3A7K9_9ALTE|nr:histidine kinase [Aestuariibacter sp. AA17]MCV2884665.1 histidine kinase [Aestuariibacter sp. AA17]
MSFWLAAHFMFTQVQYQALQGSSNELSWMATWLKLSPWFLLWIPITAIEFIIVQRAPSRKHERARKIIYHLLWAMVLLTVYWITATFLRALIESQVDQVWQNLYSVLTTSAQLDIYIYVFILALASGAQFYHKSMEEKLELKRLQHALSVEQLKTLRSQLNPHFLFNALNTIASLVRLKRDAEAVTGLSELSLMLRSILENKNNEDVSIENEIAFINCYLSLQKMRFTDKLDIRVQVDKQCLDIKIPNMLLHPLVENAVQHGSQLESNKNLIQLTISKINHSLQIELTNKVAKNDNHQGFGIGLSNTRERLAKLYSQFHLTLNAIDDDLFETTLVIPIGEQDAKYTDCR